VKRTFDPLPLDAPLELLRELWALDHALERTSKRMLATLGISGPQRFVLRVVGRFPRISAGQLAATLHVHPSTMTGLIRRLEHRGLVRRWSDPSDRRRVLLGLTPAGQRLDVRAHGTVEEAVERVLAKSPRARIEATRDAVRALVIELARGDGRVEE
jgi:DNA-binding MarR family transcriptional regulator